MSRLAQGVRFAVDLVVPVAAYYLLRLLGSSVYAALLVSTLISAASAVVQLVRQRHLDGLATYMTVMLLGSLVIALVSGSEQFLLAKGAVLTGVTGIWFIASTWLAKRPLAYLFSRPLIEGRLGWPGDWDGMWTRAPAFRRMWRVSSAIWGIGLLIDAAVRVWMSYRLPPDTVPALAQLLYGVTTVVLIVVTNVWYFACGIHRRSSALYLGSPGGPPLPARGAGTVGATGAPRLERASGRPRGARRDWPGNALRVRATRVRPASRGRGQPAAPTGRRPRPDAPGRPQDP